MKEVNVPDIYCHTEKIYRLFKQEDMEGIIGFGFLRYYGDYPANYNGVYNGGYAGVYVLKGSGSFVDHNGKRFKLYPGAFFQRITGLKHTMKVDKKQCWVEAFMGIRNNNTDSEASNKLKWNGNRFIDIMLNLGVLDLEKPVIYPGINLDLLHELDLCIRDLKIARLNELPGFQMRALNILETIKKLTVSDNPEEEENRFLRKACAILDEKICDRTPLPELLSKTGISYSRLRALFRKELGISPGDYRIRQRIDYACKLLSEADNSVKETARILNYPDQFNFSAQFKKITGMTPAEFKRRH